MVERRASHVRVTVRIRLGAVATLARSEVENQVDPVSDWENNNMLLGLTGEVWLTRMRRER